MPILKKPPETEPRKAVTIRIQQSVNISLHQYAEFLGCSLDHVVVEALKLACLKFFRVLTKFNWGALQ